MRAEVDILLVEDNPNDAELTLRALKKHHRANNIHHVKDGVEALDFIFGNGTNGKVHRPKAILLDLKLPKVDGIEVLRRIKSDDRTKSIPVVVLTSSREDRDIVETYRLGVNSFITKPVDFQQFVSAVSELGLYWILVNTSPL